MIIYNGTKSQFIKDFDDGLLIRTIRENLLKKLGLHTGTSELRSWQNSLPYMYVVLADKKNT